MSEEQSESRDSEWLIYDPLRIEDRSKDPEKSYQWFRSKDESITWPWRSPEYKGWALVLREEMHTEPTDHDEFIQRNEMRLYWRTRVLSDAAVFSNIKTALDQIKNVEARNNTIIVPDYPKNYIPPDKKWMPARKSGMYKYKKRRIFIVHGIYAAPLMRICKFYIKRHQRMFATCRIVYLSWDEADMAYKQGTSYTEWAWRKRDYLMGGL